uniref:Uncharacterized protein n=1 Tax=Anopheles atroparvus TaxID=41427 RepID=A0A182ISF7_ANOAO
MTGVKMPGVVALTNCEIIAGAIFVPSPSSIDLDDSSFEPGAPAATRLKLGDFRNTSNVESLLMGVVVSGVAAATAAVDVDDSWLAFAVGFSDFVLDSLPESPAPPEPVNFSFSCCSSFCSFTGASLRTTAPNLSGFTSVAGSCDFIGDTFFALFPAPNPPAGPLTSSGSVDFRCIVFLRLSSGGPPPIAADCARVGVSELTTSAGGTSETSFLVTPCFAGRLGLTELAAATDETVVVDEKADEPSLPRESFFSPPSSGVVLGPDTKFDCFFSTRNDPKLGPVTETAGAAETMVVLNESMALEMMALLSTALGAVASSAFVVGVTVVINAAGVVIGDFGDLIALGPVATLVMTLCRGDTCSSLMATEVTGAPALTGVPDGTGVRAAAEGGELFSSETSRFTVHGVDWGEAPDWFTTTGVEPGRFLTGVSTAESFGVVGFTSPSAVTSRRQQKAIFSELAIIVAAVPYVFTGGFPMDVDDGAAVPAATSCFSTGSDTSTGSFLTPIVFASVVVDGLTPTVGNGSVDEESSRSAMLAASGDDFGLATMAVASTGVSAVSESTIVVMGELENALFDDWDESSSLSVSDSDDFSCSSSSSVTVDSSSFTTIGACSFFTTVMVAAAFTSPTSSADGMPIPAAFGSRLRMMCFGMSDGLVVQGTPAPSPVAVVVVVVVVVVVSDAGEPGDLSSLKPFSSERI